MPTVCVVNGHTIGGGVFVALGFEHLIMKDDPKFQFKLNELENGLIIPAGLIRLTAHKTSPHTLSMLILNKRFNPQNALSSGIVDSLYKDENDLLQQIQTYSKTYGPLSSQRKAMIKTKEIAYKPLLENMMDYEHFPLEPMAEKKKSK